MLRGRSEDDGFVRGYHRLLVTLRDATEQSWDEYVLANPDIYRAHEIHYAAHPELRQITQARLLTSETFAEIATQLGVTPRTVEYFANLFYDVRDRLQHRAWVHAMLLRPPRVKTRSGALTAEQRGFAYRLFAYHGGGLALEAVVNGLVSAKMPQREQDVGPWFEDALGQLVRAGAAVAASVFEFNRSNVIQALKLAIKTRAGAPPATATSEVDVKKIWEAVKKTVDGPWAGGSYTTPLETEPLASANTGR